MPASEWLRGVPLVEGFSDDQLDIVADMFNIRRLEPGAWLLREGEIGREMFVLIEGEADVLKVVDQAKRSLTNIAVIDHYKNTSKKRGC